MDQNNMKSNPTVEFEKFLRDKTAVEIANLVSEYLMESNHQGWDGFKSQDLTGIRKLFVDMMYYFNSACADTHDFKGNPPTNGSVYAYKWEGPKSNVMPAHVFTPSIKCARCGLTLDHEIHRMELYPTIDPKRTDHRGKRSPEPMDPTDHRLE